MYSNVHKRDLLMTFESLCHSRQSRMGHATVFVAVTVPLVRLFDLKVVVIYGGLGKMHTRLPRAQKWKRRAKIK